MRLLHIVVLLAVCAGCLQAVEIEIPEYPEPADNAFDHYLAATELIPEEPEWERLYNREEAYDLAHAELVVLDAAEILETLRKGIGKPCVIPGDMDFATQFPYLNQFRSLMRLLMIEAWLHKENGDFDAAFNSYLDAMTLGQDAARGGPLVHKLFSIAGEAIALSHIRRSLAVAGGESEAIETLIGRLAEFEQSKVPLSETLAVEYGYARNSLLQMKEDPKQEEAVQEATGLPMPGFFVDGALEDLTLYYAQAIAVAKTDYWRWAAERSQEPAPGTNPLVSTLAPVVGKAREKQVRHLANLRGTLLVAALEPYFAHNGHYPEKLELLVPDTLDELPVDPCSGESFRYQVLGPLEYSLHSVGLNGADDGGGDPLDPDPDALDIVFSTLR